MPEQSVHAPLDGSELQPGVTYTGPPIGWKVVGPGSEWEQTPAGLRGRSLPYDPARKRRVVPSDDFAADGSRKENK